MPEQDAVLAITGGIGDMQQPMNLVWEILLPAMGTEPLAEDEASQDSLTKKLSGLTFFPVHGAVSSPTAAKVSGQTYKVDPNKFGVETIALNFTEADCIVRIKTAAVEATIPCGYGMWQSGQTSLFNEPGRFDPTRLVASGAWTADDTFTMVVRLYETPFFYTFVFCFAEDELLAETSVNASFEPLIPVMLVGRVG